MSGRAAPCFWCRTGNVVTTSTISEERCRENHLEKLKKIKKAEENASAFCVANLVNIFKRINNYIKVNQNFFLDICGLFCYNKCN